MSISANLNEIECFGLNLCDLSKLSPVELLLVQDKISSRELVKINDNIDGTVVLLRSTIKNNYSNSNNNKQKTQLKATCELIWKYSRVRSYYSKNGRKFDPIKFN
ncbi:MAG: hypothetical protein KGD61_07540 [Candidatus Lokiarchaeota archaeon]|nr:hypothetical protein [Candidatus Lokiarchaeota archaeon]